MLVEVCRIYAQAQRVISGRGDPVVPEDYGTAHVQATYLEPRHSEPPVSGELHEVVSAFMARTVISNSKSGSCASSS